MARAVHVDGMIQVHNTYIQKIKEQCLLGAKVPTLSPPFPPPPPPPTQSNDKTASTNPPSNNLNPRHLDPLLRRPPRTQHCAKNPRRPQRFHPRHLSLHLIPHPPSSPPPSPASNRRARRQQLQLRLKLRLRRLRRRQL